MGMEITAKGETEREVAARQEETSRRDEAKAKEAKARAAKEAREIRIREQSREASSERKGGCCRGTIRGLWN